MNPESRTVLHTWSVPARWDAPTIAGGAGAWFWDDAGRRYLDMSSLSECCNLGHQHPAVVRAIQTQPKPQLHDLGLGRRAARAPRGAPARAVRLRRRAPCTSRSAARTRTRPR
jgi:acetylornithine/succinyldiaminopimelate/putrescine aminotransferase